MIHNDRSRNYALALFGLAEERNQFLTYKSNARDLVNALRPHPDFLTLLSLKSISMQNKSMMLDAILQPLGNEHFNNLIALLVSKSQVKMLEKILLKLISLINKKLRIKEGFVFSTTKLSLLQLRKLEAAISSQVHSQVELKNLIDKTLIAGFKIVVDDVIIEDNVLARINEIKLTLLGGTQ